MDDVAVIIIIIVHDIPHVVDNVGGMAIVVDNNVGDAARHCRQCG